MFFPEEEILYNLPYSNNKEDDDEWNEKDTESQGLDTENYLPTASEASIYNRQTKRSRTTRIPERLNDYVQYEAKEVSIS